MIFTCEAEQVNIIVKYYESLGYDVTTEVPNMNQYVDIVAIKDGLMTCIEAKLRDWKRAVKQCEPHVFVSDYIYIVIGTKIVSTGLIESAKEKGYGVIHCSMWDGKIKMVLESIKHTKYWLPQREVFLKGFYESKECWKNHIEVIK